jgi:hypothetical protein
LESYSAGREFKPRKKKIGFQENPWPKKKPREEERENLDRWLVSYADFITLLLPFCDHVRHFPGG